MPVKIEENLAVMTSNGPGVVKSWLWEGGWCWVFVLHQAHLMTGNSKGRCVSKEGSLVYYEYLLEDIS